MNSPLPWRVRLKGHSSGVWRCFASSSALHFHRLAQIQVEFGGGHHAVALALGDEVALPLKRGKERVGKGRMARAVPCLLATHTDGLAAQHVQRLLVVGRRGEDLPRRLAHEAVVVLPVERRPDGRQVAAPVPGEGAGKAAVEDHQQVAAGQRLEPAVEVGHGHEGAAVVGFARRRG